MITSARELATIKKKKSCAIYISCLHSPFNTVGALERAKFAVEQQYAVVGVLEDFNTTLSVLEKYVPRFFEGVRDIYAS